MSEADYFLTHKKKFVNELIHITWFVFANPFTLFDILYKQAAQCHVYTLLNANASSLVGIIMILKNARKCQLCWINMLILINDVTLRPLSRLRSPGHFLVNPVHTFYR